ncbi:hypothetical protein CERZMDRAFT_106201 [Cercospora zeae-maydis SCOH1-5]|uniref:Uncharacterized protein n=1 Tax=Cercospora zeae-maydis SCOH1-5 TaxID=717836 RepID=A0A6A6FGC7_9PEZI|nr:hypothetical protein CERZMDRAFT_106201 [Cercospora zeae-maydis SCOH1-5]
MSPPRRLIRMYFSISGNGYSPAESPSTLGVTSGFENSRDTVTAWRSTDRSYLSHDVTPESEVVHMNLGHEYTTRRRNMVGGLNAVALHRSDARFRATEDRGQELLTPKHYVVCFHSFWHIRKAVHSVTPPGSMHGKGYMRLGSSSQYLTNMRLIWKIGPG